MEFVAETGSTNGDIAARLRAGQLVPEGHWLVADRQTQGRGRQGRTWLGGAGNFMGSTVVHVRPGDPEPATLALVTGLAVHELVSAHLPAGERVWLKWPNDIFVGEAKLAGVLLERVENAVVVGIGVNLAHAPLIEDRPAVALADLGADLAAVPSRDAFAADLAIVFEGEIARWRSYGLAAIVSRWVAAAHPIGTLLSVVDQGQAITGAFSGLSDDGGLELRLADGSRRVIHSGEVQLARPVE